MLSTDKAQHHLTPGPRGPHATTATPPPSVARSTPPRAPAAAVDAHAPAGPRRLATTAPGHAPAPPAPGTTSPAGTRRTESPVAGTAPGSLRPLRLVPHAGAVPVARRADGPSPDHGHTSPPGSPPPTPPATAPLTRWQRVVRWFTWLALNYLPVYAAAVKRRQDRAAAKRVEEALADIRRATPIGTPLGAIEGIIGCVEWQQLDYVRHFFHMIMPDTPWLAALPQLLARLWEALEQYPHLTQKQADQVHYLFIGTLGGNPKPDPGTRPQWERLRRRLLAATHTDRLDRQFVRERVRPLTDEERAFLSTLRALWSAWHEAVLAGHGRYFVWPTSTQLRKPYVP